MVTLSDKLKSLGVRVGVEGLAAPRPRAEYPIEQVLKGRFDETEYGQAFIVETLYPAGHRHGSVELAGTPVLATISEWARDLRLSGTDPRRLFYIDTETTGLAGGTGTFAFLIGVGRFGADGFTLTQYFMRDPAKERAVLAALASALAECGGIVTFNGKSFDVPLLATRYVLNGFDATLKSYPHLDLLPLARRLWRDRLESRALGSLEEHILSAQRSYADVPGQMIPQMYFDYLRSGDARPLARVFYHNAADVVALAALLGHVSQMLDDGAEMKIEHGTDLLAVARLFEELGRIDQARRVYRHALEQDLEESVFRQATLRLAALEKRYGAIGAAVELWRQATQRQEVYAYVELAKHYEHRVRDYDSAEAWTRRALAVVKGRDVSPEARREWLALLEHRLKRVQAKGRGERQSSVDR